MENQYKYNGDRVILPYIVDRIILAILGIISIPLHYYLFISSGDNIDISLMPILTILYGVLFVLFCISGYGLIALKNWGRQLYRLSCIGGFLPSCLVAYKESTPMYDANNVFFVILYMFFILIGFIGVIVGLWSLLYAYGIYFCSKKQTILLFTKKKTN